MTRRIAAASVAIVAVITGLWYFALWKPQTTKLAAAHRAVASAEANQSTLLGQIATLRRLEAQVPALRQSLRTLQSDLPATAGLDTTIRQINAAAQSAGVTWQSLTPQLNAASATSGPAAPAGRSSGVSSVALSMTVTGTYHQIMGFLRNLDALPRLMVTNGVSLSSNGNQQLAASLNSEVFFMPAGAS